MKPSMAILTYTHDSNSFSWSLLFTTDVELDLWLDAKLANGTHYKDIKLYTGNTNSEYTLSKVWKREVIASNKSIQVEKHALEI